MPRPDHLPGDLKDLAYRNAVELTHARWKSDVQVLIAALRPHIDEPAADAVEANAVQQKQTAGPVDEFPEKHAAHEAPVVASGLSVQSIEHVARILAGYIGPIADVVVRRAARQCASETDLCGMVAREIEVDADRTRFLRACRGYPFIP
jgi:hypothetical protein